LTQPRTDLSQDEIPRKWYNILPDLPEQIPSYKDAETGKAMRNLPGIYTKTASQLEFSENRWIDMPSEVTDQYVRHGRPTPLIRAHNLEEVLRTPARIYYKCEDLPPVGTFKTNTAIPQAYWAMKEGYHRTVFSGSTQTRTKFVHTIAARMFGLTPTLFMTRIECEKNREQVFFLRHMLEADLVESPSRRTETGLKTLSENPNHQGTRIIMEDEVLEEVRQHKEAVVVVSSFLNHVLLTQTIIGLELQRQLELIDERPSVLVASVGSGSHLHGLIAPFMRDRKTKGLIRFLAAESETSSKLANGKYGYVTRQGPLALFRVKAYECDWKTTPPPIRGRGIQTRNTAPLLSFLRHLGIIDTRVYSKDETLIQGAAKLFLQTEGRLLAPESAYAIRAAIDEALDARKGRDKTVIVASISGTAYLDFGEKKAYSGPG